MHTPDKINDIRSGVRAENLQEVIDAAVSSAHAFQGGQQQYQTPEWLATVCAQLLPSRPNYALDPQCAGGNLLQALHTYGMRLGCELDHAFSKSQNSDKPISRITASCLRLGAVLDELFPLQRFDCIVANPPFGIRWKTPNGSVDSTQWTWEFIDKHIAQNGYGFFIASAKTIESLEIHRHRMAYLYQRFPAGIWPDVKVEIGIVHYYNATSYASNSSGTPESATQTRGLVAKEWGHIPSAGEILSELRPQLVDRFHVPSYNTEIERTWNSVKEVIADDTRDRPQYNIYLGADGMLRTYLSTRVSLKIKFDEIAQLARINNCHPLTLTTERETRKLLHKYLTDGIYTIEPAAKIAITTALREVVSLACPIRPVTDFELVSYADEEDSLLCKNPQFAADLKIKLTQGKRYEIRTGTYTFRENFSRKKIHFDEESGKTTQEDHECALTGEDRYIEITDDARTMHRFMDRPDELKPWQHHESSLWQLFKEPYVPTVAETDTENYEKNLAVMQLNELIAGFTYFDGQRDYYARMACKDYGLIAADVGTGKSLGALTMIALKAPKRTLLIAPQGTMRSVGDEDEIDYEASQWVKEIHRFAPTEPVFQLFSRDDWQHILRANGNQLPPGIYITYPQAYFTNNSFESCPETWADKGLTELKFCERMGLVFDAQRSYEDSFSRNLGASNKHGIKCIAEPSLAIDIASRHGEWDMVIIDEAHLCCNLDAQITQKLLRLQPKYRFAMTATPIPNIVSNLFSLMGWICVPHWYKGKVRNAGWPYAVDEGGRFSSTFLSTEIDMTAQYKAKSAGKRGWRNVGVKISPLISSPARLLKLLKPNMAYISKEDCNPNLKPCEVVDVRVPLGKEQAVLYAHWLDRANYRNEFKSMLTIAQVQSGRLRGICAAPASLTYTRKMCNSNFNPKTVAIIQLIRDCLNKGEQCVVVSARVDQSSALSSRLTDAGIPIARIDSTIKAEIHTAEANRFKRGDARVMLMGIKCAQGHSFDQCPNLIIASLEWSYGTLHQAKGRVWRLTSPKAVKVWCVLHTNTIEELLFDRVATKQDAATLCLHGKRVPRDFKTMDAAEVLADHVINYDANNGEILSETECESQWPSLRQQLVLANKPQQTLAA